MTVDWGEIQKALYPLKSFEVLGANLRASFAYAFVQQHFNFSMPQMEEYTARLLGGDTRQRYGAYLAALTGAYRQLAACGTADVRQLVKITASRAAFAAFCENGPLDPRTPASMLKFLNYWFLPIQKTLGELARPEEGLQDAFPSLRACGIRCNLDLLEQGHNPAGREALAESSGLPLEMIVDLVNRADFSRLPWASKATISNYVGAGCGSLAKLADADPQRLAEDFYKYGQSIGKNLKHGNEIDNGQRIARVVPRVVVEA